MSAMATSKGAWRDHQPVDLDLAAPLEIPCCGDDADLVPDGHPVERSAQEILETLGEIRYPLITDELRLDSIGCALELQERRADGRVGRVDIGRSVRWDHLL